MTDWIKDLIFPDVAEILLNEFDKEESAVI